MEIRVRTINEWLDSGVLIYLEESEYEYVCTLLNDGTREINQDEFGRTDVAITYYLPLIRRVYTGLKAKCGVNADDNFEHLKKHIDARTIVDILCRKGHILHIVQSAFTNIDAEAATLALLSEDIVEGIYKDYIKFKLLHESQRDENSIPSYNEWNKLIKKANSLL